MIFDFRLKVFYTVAQRLSFTKAAGELFITQPAVTKHIKELEQQLYVQLFKRNGNNINLTTAGKILLQYTEKIFQTYGELETELAQLTNIEAGTGQHIGASTTVAQTILPKLLALFKKTYPAVAFTFIRVAHRCLYFTQQVKRSLISLLWKERPITPSSRMRRLQKMRSYW